MIRFFLIFLISFSAFAMEQNEAETIVAEGNRLFGEENFSEAIQTYEKALQFHPSAQIFFNIGQSYWALQKPGFALAYYLKAKNIAPYWKLLNDTLHSFYQQNPQFTNKAFPWYHTLFCYFQWNTWKLLITIFLCLTVCSFVYYQLFCRKKIVLFSILSNLLFFILSLLLFIFNYSFKDLYICPDTTPVFFAPTDNSPVRYNLLPGTQCTVKEIRSHYFFINTLDNKDGWVKKVSLISL